MKKRPVFTGRFSLTGSRRTPKCTSTGQQSALLFNDLRHTVEDHGGGVQFGIGNFPVGFTSHARRRVPHLLRLCLRVDTVAECVAVAEMFQGVEFRAVRQSETCLSVSSSVAHAIFIQRLGPLVAFPLPSEYAPIAITICGCQGFQRSE